jgi:hypothetical protein
MPDDWSARAAEGLSVVHLLAPGRVGGLESVVRALAVGQAHRGVAVHVAAVLGAPGESPEWLQEIGGEGVGVVPLHLPGRRYMRERAAIAGLCRELRPSVVHTHGYRPDVVGASGARLEGVATVSTVHGFTGGGWKNRLSERVPKTFEAELPDELQKVLDEVRKYE